MVKLTSTEKCWFLIGASIGVIFTILLFGVWEYLPKLAPVERALFGGIIIGGASVWLLQKTIEE